MYSILVVDDEEMIRRLIAKYAAFEGHSVTEAGDGMSAVQMCREGQFDIVILDIMMPELDGFSACREIRKFSDVPISMLSARGEEYDKINGFNLGRFWNSKGPQRTLYLPAPLLKEGDNEIVVLEYDAVTEPVVDFEDKNDIG